MSHLAIYRKYRPTNFEDVSGQKVVVNILKNAIKDNNISHAYLFNGPRGTGKTSIAKIFSRTINCDALENGNPCNKCSSCHNSLSKECVDIIEIDAASNNGVDEIRELKSKINIVPSYLKYKVYIIDEVHMLSIGAFNALLKTLEEPPSHAIFILATTELQKVPATILSRCQILEFKKISPLDMKTRIKEICELEKIGIDELAIDEIIDNSDGCMRDALSFLEKANAYCNNNIHLEEVRLLNGKTPKDFIGNLISSIIDCDLEQSITKINEAYDNDYDMLYIAEDIINELEKYIFTDKKQDNRHQLLLSKMIDIYDKIKNSAVNNKIIFEIEIFNYCNNNNKIISREIIIEQKSNRNKDIENAVKENTLIEKQKEETTKFEFDNEKFKKIRTNNTFVSANKESLNKIKINWEKLRNNAFNKDDGALICSLLDGTPIASSDDYLILKYLYENETYNINEKYFEYEKIIKKYLGMEIHIVAVSEEEWKQLKNEYIQKNSLKEKYEMILDSFNEKNIHDNKEEFVFKMEPSNSLEKDNKVYELFDSKYIEIE